MEGVEVRELQREHELISLYEAGKTAIVAMWDMFVPALEKAVEAFAEICKMLDDVLVETTWDLSKWYNPTDRRAYRKIHRITPRRRIRRGRRQGRGMRYDGVKQEVVEDEGEEEIA